MDYIIVLFGYFKFCRIVTNLLDSKWHIKFVISTILLANIRTGVDQC